MMFVHFVQICLILLAATTCSMTQNSRKCKAMHCVSWNFSHVQCKVQENISTIKLLQQHSISKCVHGRTFGTFGRHVWVKSGCRGTFEICFGAYKHRHALHDYYKVIQ